MLFWIQLTLICPNSEKVTVYSLTCSKYSVNLLWLSWNITQPLWCHFLNLMTNSPSPVDEKEWRMYLNRKPCKSKDVGVCVPTNQVDLYFDYECHIYECLQCWTVVFLLSGGFKASVNMKGPDFECSSEGSVCSASHEARNSAASNLLAKLRSMAAEL